MNGGRGLQEQIGLCNGTVAVRLHGQTLGGKCSVAIAFHVNVRLSSFLAVDGATVSILNDLMSKGGDGLLGY